MKKADNFLNFGIGGPDPDDPESTTVFFSSESFEEVLREYFRMMSASGEPKNIFIEEWRMVDELPYPVRELNMTAGQWTHNGYLEELRKDAASKLGEVYENKLKKTIKEVHTHHVNIDRNSISIDVEYTDESVETVAEFDRDTGKVFWMNYNWKSDPPIENAILKLLHQLVLHKGDFVRVVPYVGKGLNRTAGTIIEDVSGGQNAFFKIREIDGNYSSHPRMCLVLVPKFREAPSVEYDEEPVPGLLKEEFAVLGRHDFCTSPRTMASGHGVTDGKGDEVYEALEDIKKKVNTYIKQQEERQVLVTKEFEYGKYIISITLPEKNATPELLKTLLPNVKEAMADGKENGNIIHSKGVAEWSCRFDFNKIDPEEETIILSELVAESPAALLTIPGLAELVREHFNNDILNKAETDEWHKVTSGVHHYNWEGKNVKNV